MSEILKPVQEQPNTRFGISTKNATRLGATTAVSIALALARGESNTVRAQASDETNPDSPPALPTPTSIPASEFDISNEDQDILIPSVYSGNGGSNIRTAAGTEFPSIGTTTPDHEYQVMGQTEGSDGYRWFLVVTEAEFNEEEESIMLSYGYIREDQLQGVVPSDYRTDKEYLASLDGDDEEAIGDGPNPETPFNPFENRGQVINTEVAGQSIIQFETPLGNQIILDTDYSTEETREAYFHIDSYSRVRVNVLGILPVENTNVLSQVYNINTERGGGVEDYFQSMAEEIGNDGRRLNFSPETPDSNFTLDTTILGLFEVLRQNNENPSDSDIESLYNSILNSDEPITTPVTLYDGSVKEWDINKGTRIVFGPRPDNGADWMDGSPEGFFAENYFTIDEDGQATIYIVSVYTNSHYLNTQLASMLSQVARDNGVTSAFKKANANEPFPRLLQLAFPKYDNWYVPALMAEQTVNGTPVSSTVGWFHEGYFN